MKILNLYAGLGGNRKKWQGHHITAIEINPEIAKIYQDQYPDDTVLIQDAHEYLINHFTEYDFIWASPPCQTHSRLAIWGQNKTPQYADLKIYEEILLLRTWTTNKWIVENVVPYYQPLIKPTRIIDRHYVWSNFNIEPYTKNTHIEKFIDNHNVQELKNWLGIQYEENVLYNGNKDPAQILRNCVHPDIGEHILKAAMNTHQSQQLQIFQ